MTSAPIRAVIVAEKISYIREMAGYRNRVVHFYNEIGEEELYRICRDELTDIEDISRALIAWLREHPHKIDAVL